MKFENTTGHKIELFADGGKVHFAIPCGHLDDDGNQSFDGRRNGISEEISDALGKKLMDANPYEFGLGELIVSNRKPIADEAAPAPKK